MAAGSVTLRPQCLGEQRQRLLKGYEQAVAQTLAAGQS